ncbi:hypothetical protein [Solirubrobacter soli]|uniref:hypothetical protein n=1 Tax=Solirubrobacter soli TaxID=363832 RepID=UPI0012F9893A|nr:hypothetical protein [Solirubrobacter soli]
MLRGLIALRVSGDQSGVAWYDIIDRYSTGEDEDVLLSLQYEGLVEFCGEANGVAHWRASDEALELAKGANRPLRRYAHMLIELDASAGTPFDALAAAVDALPGCTTLSTTIPGVTTGTSARAEGFVESAAEAHDIDYYLDNASGRALYKAAVTALTALLDGPRRSLD